MLVKWPVRKSITILQDISTIRTKIHFSKSNVSKAEKLKYLTYKILWFQNKPWHVYSKELQDDLCKVRVIFDQNSGSKPRGKFVKTVFQDVVKSEKITKT